MGCPYWLFLVSFRLRLLFLALDMNLVTPDLGLLFWSLISFVVVFFVLRGVAWKPILATIKEREDSIESALQAAKHARAEMENLKNSNEDLLKEARLEREKIVREAQATASALVADAHEKARNEASRLLDDARTTIQAEKASALAEIRNEVANLSISIAEKVLGEKLTSDPAQAALVSRYLDEAKSGLN
jgi:F-type H+-transporting ATPase subunit b